jgi:hypothetical protein
VENLSAGDTTMNEIQTDEEFLANQHAGTVIAITDSANKNKVHVLPCNYVRPEYFHEKVVVGRNKNGRYYLCDSVEEAESRLGARQCMCVGTFQPIRRDTGAT